MRSKAAPKRKINPDVIYNSVVVSKIINCVMMDGKKSVAQKQVYDMMKIVEEKSNQAALTGLTQALENLKPQMEVRARRIGGAAYQIPTPVRSERKDSLAIRWLINAARMKANKEFHTFAEKLAAEILDAMKGEGVAMKKKNDMHRMAEANKAFAHFRW